MKCPLPVIEVIPDSFPPEYGWRDCLEDECAWWLHMSKICAIAEIAVELEVISGALGSIEDKMPHEEQFRR